MQREDTIGGTPQTSPLGPSDARPLPQAVERDASQARLNTPDLAKSPAAPRPTVAVPARNIRLDDILNLDDEEDAPKQSPGLGPRLIVLHEGVQGHTRGDVIWASDLFGYDTFLAADGSDEDARRDARLRIKKGLARLTRLGAVREATRVEQGYERVVFVEDMGQAEAAIAATQAQVAELADENTVLRRRLEEANARLAGEPPSDAAPETEPPVPASTNAPPRPMRAVPVAPAPVPTPAPQTPPTPEGGETGVPNI